VTNTGQVVLSISDLQDSLQADLPASCTQGLNSSLAPGASFTCTYTQDAALPASGSLVTNVASVAGVDQFDRTVTASDPANVRVLDPAIKIVKSASASTVHVGDAVTYTLTVTNPGNTGLSNVTVT